jgi:thioredoxin-dependent peroxiredoxin
MELAVGKKAPAFTLEDKQGVKHALKDIDSEFTVLYFYPKDNTPGCTLEAVAFSTLKKKFEQLGVTIIGISGGDQKSKTRFCEKNKLAITLLSDTDNNIGKKYGVFGEKKFMGRTYLGYKRSTFLLDKNKKIIERYDNVKAATHPQQLLDDIQHRR